MVKILRNLIISGRTVTQMVKKNRQKTEITSVLCVSGKFLASFEQTHLCNGMCNLGAVDTLVCTQISSEKKLADDKGRLPYKLLMFTKYKKNCKGRSIPLIFDTILVFYLLPTSEYDVANISARSGQNYEVCSLREIYIEDRSMQCFSCSI